MAYTRYLYPKHNFALTLCTGFVEDNMLLIHLMSLHAESKSFPYIRELVDMRRLRKTHRMTVEGLIRISDLHRSLFEGRDFRAAVLVDTPMASQIVQLYAQMVSTEALKVSVFQGDLDEPLAHLGYGKKKAAEISSFIDAHADARAPLHSTGFVSRGESRILSGHPQ